MKNFKYVIVILFSFFFNMNFCNAWNGSYNYDINSFSVNGDTASITGWAILNATANDTKGSGLRQLMRGQSFKDESGLIYDDGYCKYGSMKYSNKNTNALATDSGSLNSDYVYKYELKVYELDSAGKKSKEIKEVVTKSFNTPRVSLTYAQAMKTISTVTTAEFLEFNPYSSCYENVGFEFNIDLSKLTDLSNGWIMELTIQSGKLKGCTGDKCNQTFPVLINKNASIKTEGYTLKNTTSKGKILVQGGRPWPSPMFTKDKKSVVLSQGKSYEIAEIMYDYTSKINWYNIIVNGKSGYWVPASWIIPDGDLITTIIQEDPDECITEIPVKKTDIAKTCNGEVTSKLSNENNCNVIEEKTDYYTITCNEIIVTKFNPGKEFATGIKVGQGFTYGVNVTASKVCKGVFEVGKWKNAYNIAVNDLQNSTNEQDKYSINNRINALKEFVVSYNKWTMDNYKVSPNALLNIEYAKNGKKMVDTVNMVVASQINGDKKYVVDEKIDLNVTGLTNPSNFTYSVDNYAIDLDLPKMYINKITGEVQNGNCENCLEGENKYYANQYADAGFYSVKVMVDNLGEHGNLTVLNYDHAKTNDACGINVYNNAVVYRHINLNNPFISDDREIGSNWLNNTYSFVKTINYDLWTSENSEALYIFDLTKQTIKDIKKSNNLYGADAYLGTCYDKNNRDNASNFICEVIEQ